MKNENNYMHNKRLEVLKFSKTIIAKHGLSSQTLELISKENGLNINEIELLFPDGKASLVKFSIKQLNKELEKKCLEMDLIRFPIHKRIKKILLSKIYLMNKEKKFYKKIFLNILIPKKNFFLPKELYKSVDQIWFIAGDSSVDFNFYTKRLILAGIYSRIMLFFFNNNDHKAIENLLDLNLRRVAKIPEIKSKLKIFKDYFPKILNLIKKNN